MRNKCRTCLIRGCFFYPGGKPLLHWLPPSLLRLLSMSCCPLSPFSLAVSQLSIRAHTLLPFAVPLSLALLSSSPSEPPFSPQSVELNLNDTLTEKKSLSGLILLVSPFQRAGDMAGEFEWSVRNRNGRESSLVEYLKTSHPSYVFPKGALAYLRSIISAKNLFCQAM